MKGKKDYISAAFILTLSIVHRGSNSYLQCLVAEALKFQMKDVRMFYSHNKVKKKSSFNWNFQKNQITSSSFFYELIVWMIC